jgi:hypothetical protein
LSCALYIARQLSINNGANIIFLPGEEITNSRGFFRSELSAWWRVGVLFIVMAGFAVLIIISVKAYKDSPPIPHKVVNVAGDTVFTGEDILAGQQVF